MQSVLNQTYDNWLCFVLSNGNENTVEAPNWSFNAIREMAAKDSRFVVMNKRRNDLGMYMPMLYFLAKCFPDSYICSLDADDVYQNDFFEKAVALAEEQCLDIVACGTEIVFKQSVDTAEEVLLSRREIKETCIIKQKDFTHQFLVYKPFFNEIWGKMYRADLFAEDRRWLRERKRLYLYFLPDTLYTLELLSRCQAIGILAGTSHKFYQYGQRKATNATAAVNARAADRWKLRRFFYQVDFSVYATYERVVSFLRCHGEIDDGLYEYLQAILFGWFGDFFSRTMLPTQNEKIFADLAFKLVFHPKFDEVMFYQDSGAYHNLREFEKRKEFCVSLCNTVIAQKNVQNRRAWCRKDRPCSPAVRRKLDQIAEKLEGTIQHLAKLQSTV